MPVFFLILACALWGLSFPIVKALQFEQSVRVPGASPAFLSSWLQMARFAVAGLLLAPFLLHQRPTRKEIEQGAWIGLWGGAGMAMQAWGLAYTHASTSAFLTQAYCVILPLVACLRTRRLPTRRTVAATVLVFAGGAVLSGIKPDDLQLGKGELATLAAALIFTLQILTLENPKYEGNRGMIVTFLMCIAIAVIFLPISALLAPSPSALLSAGASWPAFLLIGMLALFCSVGAYGLMNSYQPRVAATEAGLIYTTEPLFTAAFAMFLPAILGKLVGQTYANESLTTALLTGGSLILAANLLMQWKHKPHPPSIAPAG